MKFRIIFYLICLVIIVVFIFIIINQLKLMPNVINVKTIKRDEAVMSKSRAASREAMYYERLENKRVACRICFRNCVVPNGSRGFCGDRENQDGTLKLLVYNRPCAIQIDPVEKEPMFHLMPGTNILCIGTAGCNFRCKFCHNWHMAMATVEETKNFNVTPEDVVRLAKEKNCPTLSFTYNEPTVFYEYMLDIVKLAKAKGLKTIFHTNGSLNEKPLRALLQYIDGVTVDLKGFTQEFYSKFPEGARLDVVLRNLKIIREEGKWLEVVNLVIPTANDNLDDVRKMCEWIKENLGKDTPVHFNRFSPQYKLMSLSPTPIQTLEKLKQIADEVGLRYVYIGNAPGHKFNSTYCPFCGKRIIGRRHFGVLEYNIEDGKCKFCHKEIPGIWE